MSRLVLRSLTVLALLLSTAIIGCQSIDNGKGEAFVSPLASAVETPTAVMGTLQPDCFPSVASYGAVVGTLYLTDQRPAIGSILYLGEYVGLETHTPVVIVDPGRHLYTRTGEGGLFCFRDVPPGRYGLVVWDAVESMLLTDPATGYSLLVEVEAGSTADVGRIFSPIP